MGKHDKKKTGLKINLPKSLPTVKFSGDKLKQFFARSLAALRNLKYQPYAFSFYNIGSVIISSTIVIVLLFVELSPVLKTLLIVTAVILALSQPALNSLVCVSEKLKDGTDIFMFLSCIFLLCAGDYTFAVINAGIFRLGRMVYCALKNKQNVFFDKELKNTGEKISISVETESDRPEHIFSEFEEGIRGNYGTGTNTYSGAKRIYRYTSIAAAALVLIMLLIAVFTGNWSIFFRRAGSLMILPAFTGLPALCADVTKCFAVCRLTDDIFLLRDSAAELTGVTDTAVFSKTGVITYSEYKITDIKAIGVADEYLLGVAALAEQFSDHPIAKAICSNIEPEFSGSDDIHFDEIEGMGMVGHASGNAYLVGNARLMDYYSVMFRTPLNPGTAVHIAENGVYLGYIMIKAAIQDGAFDTIEYLRNQKISNFVLLSGDVKTSARQAASKLNFDMVKYELLPEDKINALKYLQDNSNPGSAVTYIGCAPQDNELLTAADNGVCLCPSYEYMIKGSLVAVSSDINVLRSVFSLCKKFVSLLNYCRWIISGYLGLALLLSCLFPVFSAINIFIYFCFICTATIIKFKN